LCAAQKVGKQGKTCAAHKVGVALSLNLSFLFAKKSWETSTIKHKKINFLKQKSKQRHTAYFLVERSF